MFYAFLNKADRDDLIRLIAMFRATGQIDGQARSRSLQATGDMLWLELPTDGIPARTGAHPGKPGKAEQCKLWYSNHEDDSPIQLKDGEGNPVLVTGWHYGPNPIPGLDENDNPRMIFAQWSGGRIVACVDYCA